MNEWNAYTPESTDNFLLDAGAYYKNLTVDDTSGTIDTAGATLLGVTSGGGQFTATPEIRTIEFDGKRFDTKGDKIIDKWTATLMANLKEITKDNLKDALGAADLDTTGTSFDIVQPRNTFEDTDYIENVSYVGRKSDGTPIVIVLDNALAIGGITVQTQDKAEAVLPVTFTAHAEGQESTDVPFRIYFKKEA